MLKSALRRKLTAGLSLLACWISANAGIIFQEIYKADLKGENPLEGWTYSGPQGQPSGLYGQMWFPNYSPSTPLSFREANGEAAVWTNSEYRDGTVSDTWLISPEIEVPDTPTLLSFKFHVRGINNQRSESICIYVSETGAEKTDFRLLSARKLQGSESRYSGNQLIEPGTEIINTALVTVPLNDLKGKRIRFALVNEGNSNGVAGFSDIKIAPWYADFSSFSYPENMKLSQNTDQTDFRFPLKAVFPYETNKIDYVFKTPSGFELSGTEECDTEDAKGMMNFQFAVNNIPVTQEYTPYTLTVIPQYEGAVPLIWEGLYYKTEPGYESVALVEDATGMWCGWCPFGIAALAYYKERLTGADGTRKMIAVGVHSGDVLEIDDTDNDYLDRFVHTLGVNSYPSLYFNRRRDSVNPTAPRTTGNRLDRLFGEKAYAHVDIDGWNEENGKYTVEFTVKSSLDTHYYPLSCSLLIVEDEVMSESDGYAQTSYLRTNGITRDYIAKNFGEDWVEYFESFYDRGSVLGLVYEDVARAALPSFAGMALPEYDADTEIPLIISFEMPATVKVAENVRAVAIVTDGATGEVYGADEIRLRKQEKPAGVESSIIRNEPAIRWTGGMLQVDYPEVSDIRVVTADGLTLAECCGVVGSVAIPVERRSGMLIVTVSTPSGLFVKKLFPN